MSREIRRVPANWEHPKFTSDNCYRGEQIGTPKPLRDNYDKRLAEFQAMAAEKGMSEALEYYGGGPMKSDFACYEGKPLDWWQMYETVSEGTPLTPPFATAEELVDYLECVGDSWTEKPWPRARAEAFVKAGWAPSMILAGGKVYTSEESVDLLEKGSK